MKRKSLFALIIICLTGLSLNPVQDCAVKWVFDGDTVLLRSGQRVRYVGIDAPEIGHGGKKSEYMALASKAFNRRLTGGARVRLEFDRVKRDRHGRLLAYVFLENGDMVNALLVKEGLAHVMAQKPNLKYFSLLLENQRKAMKENLGIWRRTPRIPERFYRGNKKSYRLHRPSCPFSKDIHPRNLIIFEKRRDALWEGYSPCRHCKP